MWEGTLSWMWEGAMMLLKDVCFSFHGAPVASSIWSQIRLLTWGLKKCFYKMMMRSNWLRVECRCFRLLPMSYHISRWWCDLTSIHLWIVNVVEQSQNQYTMYVSKLLINYAEKWSSGFAWSWFDAGRRKLSWPPMSIRSVWENIFCTSDIRLNVL